jgi:fucose 4-O-acetylase-like acetyltransferase
MESLIQNKPRQRSLFLDQIKAIMIALVIASHTVLLASLSSDGVGQLIKDAPLFEGVNLWFVWVSNTFFMNILFLISGYLLPESVQKQGLKQFAKNRLIRLGIPLIFSIILINNILPIGGLLVPDSPAFGQNIINLPLNRIGPQWFLVVLILFNALYCIWVGFAKPNFQSIRKHPFQDGDLGSSVP